MAPAQEGSSENLKIIEYIQDLGSCWRCATRFTRERKPEAYQRKLVVIISIVNCYHDRCVIHIMTVPRGETRTRTGRKIAKSQSLHYLPGISSGPLHKRCLC